MVTQRIALFSRKESHASIKLSAPSEIKYSIAKLLLRVDF